MTLAMFFQSDLTAELRLHKQTKVEPDMPESKYFTHILLLFGQYICVSKQRIVRKIFVFRFAEVLSEQIFVKSSKKAEKC